MKRLFLIYFSGTGTTCRCVRKIAESFSYDSTEEYNLADNPTPDWSSFDKEDMLIVGMPVYGGRIPQYAVKTLQTIQGNQASAAAVVVYGNRDYDDALLELADLLQAQGCRLCGAGAFVARHSIFPRVAAGRPDEKDLQELKNFGDQLAKKVRSDGDYTPLEIKGNRPYKKYGGVPIHPQTDKTRCTQCGVCASKCPTGAIDKTNPQHTDHKKCITCGRCIEVCGHDARSYRGIKYNLIRKIFETAFSRPNRPFTSVTS